MAVGRSDLLSAILVGAVWGITNPFLRRGSSGEESGSISKKKTAASTKDEPDDESGKTSYYGSIIESLLLFRRVSVWLPYLLNQSGSLLYYKLLAEAPLSLAVPVCNAMALVFSSITSLALGERVDRPMFAAMGSLLVTVGVGICMASTE
jgi:hypothetical protein